MPQVKVIKGGWFWLGVLRQAGDVLDAPSDAWVANRVADGLVEPTADVRPAPIETAAVSAPETAVAVPLPSQRASAKQRNR